MDICLLADASGGDPMTGGRLRHLDEIRFPTLLIDIIAVFPSELP
jgi:hypothetical protein